MIRFKKFLTERFTHSTHLEDLVLDMGVDGTRSAINALRDFRDAFAGKSGKKNLNLSVKWDGAPAVIFGTDPETGQFFVGSKGVFNKNPKINYTHEDIDRNHPGGLAEKLHDALTYLPLVTPKGRVFQGDFMYSASDLRHETVNGEDSIIMHPNTIVYSTPTDSKLGREILASKMGIVVHTEYTGGPKVQDLKAKFGVRSDDFKKNPKVWLQDALYHSAEGVGNFTSSELAKMNRLLSNIGKLFKSTSSSTFKLLSQDKELNQLVNSFNNTKIRAGTGADPKKQADEFVDWLNARFDKEADKRKSDKGKAGVEAKRQLVLKKVNKKELTNIFMLQAMINEAKIMVIQKLNEIGGLNTFVRDKDGFKVTNHEGFVGISGDIAGVKLVDRLEFSHNNFSKEIIKGWEGVSRK